MQYGPNPNAIYPNEAIKSVCYIKNVGIMVVQKLRVQKMDSYRRTILLHSAAAGRHCEFYILLYITGVWRTDKPKRVIFDQKHHN